MITYIPIVMMVSDENNDLSHGDWHVTASRLRGSECKECRTTLKELCVRNTRDIQKTALWQCQHNWYFSDMIYVYVLLL